MSFLAPSFLLLGAAALVPLLIHLLRRRVGVEVEFPAARYLARAEREHSRTLRMRNLLLMLLRMLAILLLAGAAARPTAPVGGAGHAPTALAIVIDNSMSTSVVEGGTPLIDRFKQMAREVASSATPEDRLWLVTADGAVRGGAAAGLAEEIDRVQPLAGAGNMRDAIGRAAAAVQASALVSRHVVVLTDGQRTAWTQPTQLREPVPVLVFAPAGTAPANRSVSAAEARPVRWTPRGAVATRVVTPDSTTYRMALGDRTFARGTVAPGEEATIRAAPAERGWTAGRIEIEPDELSADNLRHFALWIGPAPSVRVSAGAGEFVARAVEVLRSSNRVTDGSAIAVGPADEVTTIPALLLPPADPVRLGAANRALERLGIPWRFGPMRRESSVARGEQVDGVAVTWRYPLVARGAPEADTLARVGGDPWMIAGPRYAIIGSPLVPDATALPISAAFLPWLGGMLSAHLHADPGTVRYAPPGARVPRPSGVDAIESAAGARTALTGTSFEAPGAAGTYFFIRAGRRTGALVVNSESEESRLERWPTTELRSRVASTGARVVTSRDEWRALAFSGASRQSVVVPLLWAALLVLAVEMLVATGTRRDAR